MNYKKNDDRKYMNQGFCFSSVICYYIVTDTSLVLLRFFLTFTWKYNLPFPALVFDVCNETYEEKD